MRKLQEELEAYWKGAQRHINSGVELGRELDKLKEQVPKEAIDIKAQDVIASVKQPLQAMKQLGDRLRTNNLRVMSIKSHLE